MKFIDYKAILIFILCCIVLGCKKSIKNEILENIQEKCKSSTNDCIIDLQTITFFKWDKMYLFGQITGIEQISREIGFTYTGDAVPDKKQRMLFAYNKHVVYEEDFKQLDYRNSMIIFHAFTDSSHKAQPYYCLFGEGFFKIKKDKIDGSCNDCFYYDLMPVNKK